MREKLGCTPLRSGTGSVIQDDHSDQGASCKGTNESLNGVNWSVSGMHPEQSDLGSLFLIHIKSKKHSVGIRQIIITIF